MLNIAHASELIDNIMIKEVGHQDFKSIKSVINTDFIVFIAFGTDCPIFKSQIPNLKKIIPAYTDKKVSFLLINSIKNASDENLLSFKKDYSLDFPIYFLNDSNLLKKLKFTTLSQAVFYQRSTDKILYSGAINNQFTFDLVREKATKNYLTDALDSALSGKKIREDKSKIFGCAITF